MECIMLKKVPTNHCVATVHTTLGKSLIEIPVFSLVIPGCDRTVTTDIFLSINFSFSITYCTETYISLSLTGLRAPQYYS